MGQHQRLEEVILDVAVWNVNSPTQTYCSSRVIFHDFSLTHMYIFPVSVLIPDPMPINCAMKIWQIRPQHVHPSDILESFALLTSHVNTFSDVERLVNQTLECP